MKLRREVSISVPERTPVKVFPLLEGVFELTLYVVGVAVGVSLTGKTVIVTVDAVEVRTPSLT